MREVQHKKDNGHQTMQYQNQQQIQYDTNKKESYQQNVVINHYQENNNPHSTRKEYREIIPIEM